MSTNTDFLGKIGPRKAKSTKTLHTGGWRPGGGYELASILVINKILRSLKLDLGHEILCYSTLTSDILQMPEILILVCTEFIFIVTKDNEIV